VRWQVVPHTRACSSETSVIETVARPWKGACPGGGWTQRTVISVRHELDVVGYMHMSDPLATGVRHKTYAVLSMLREEDENAKVASVAAWLTD